MKKTILLSLVVFCIISCKKSDSINTNPPPGNPNNVVTAVVSVKGGPLVSSTSSGNNTLFAKRTDPNGDVVITVLGGFSSGQAVVTMVNISATGNYTINGGGTQYTLGRFEIGNPLTGPYEFFGVAASPPSSGTITIDELTNSGIKGSFAMTCTGSTGSVQITNGAFKGIY